MIAQDLRNRVDHRNSCPGRNRSVPSGAKNKRDHESLTLVRHHEGSVLQMSSFSGTPCFIGSGRTERLRCPGLRPRKGRGRSAIASPASAGSGPLCRSRLCRPPRPAKTVGGQALFRRRPPKPPPTLAAHPTCPSQGPRPTPWCASRRHRVSIRGIMPSRGRGPGLSMKCMDLAPDTEERRGRSPCSLVPP